jgi:phosphopantetheinyl transferase (holo-ACP synthase)
VKKKVMCSAATRFAAQQASIKAGATVTSGAHLRFPQWKISRAAAGNFRVQHFHSRKPAKHRVPLPAPTPTYKNRTPANTTRSSPPSPI